MYCTNFKVCNFTLLSLKVGGCFPHVYVHFKLLAVLGNLGKPLVWKFLTVNIGLTLLRNVSVCIDCTYNRLGRRPLIQKQLPC